MPALYVVFYFIFHAFRILFFFSFFTKKPLYSSVSREEISLKVLFLLMKQLFLLIIRYNGLINTRLRAENLKMALIQLYNI